LFPGGPPGREYVFFDKIQADFAIGDDFGMAGQYFELLVTVVFNGGRMVGVDTDGGVYGRVAVGKVDGLRGTGEIDTDGDHSSYTTPACFRYHLVTVFVVSGHIKMAMGVNGGYAGR
jgi:hypothetical protein